ncbi:FUSC family protein [Methylobacterium oryzisoli]|uniref:FUSC family protein n=1 Tax=Methylobacterium oryzisoli TaxID=3385502 RepID=UPI00389224C6
MARRALLGPSLPARWLAETGVPFGLRSALSALATLWLAMRLELDTPHWAAWTVLAIVLPTRGQVGLKGLWRVGGTLIGLVAGVAAVAAFAQAGLAMGAFLALWFALNAYAGSRLPGFPAHGAALSGLTAGLIAILSAASPLSAFATALARGAEIMLGVACVYVASAIAEVVQGPPEHPAPPPSGMPDGAAALANAVRTFLVTVVAWAVWTATAWPSGGVFVLFSGVVAVVFATIPDADRRSRAYLWGAGLGLGAGLVVKYGFLVAPTSFGLLAATLFPFLFIGAVGMTDPRTASAALGYNLSFLIAVTPANPMQYDLAASLNQCLAVFAGIAFATAAFRLVLPDWLWRAAR